MLRRLGKRSEVTPEAKALRKSLLACQTHAMSQRRSDSAEVPLSHGGVWTNENGKFLNLRTWVAAPVALAFFICAVLALAYLLA